MLLTEAVSSLGELEVASLACITITPRHGEIVATFSISASLPVASIAELPKGLALSGLERWPDQERVIDWRIPLPVQIEELKSDARLGTLNLCQLGADSWRIKTHAGSDAERREWMFRK